MRELATTMVESRNANAVANSNQDTNTVPNSNKENNSNVNINLNKLVRNNRANPRRLKDKDSMDKIKLKIRDL
jgi:hypothetical protein